MLSAVLSAACTTGADVDGTSAWDPSGAPQDGDTGTTTEAESAGDPATGSGTTEALEPHGDTDTSTGSAEPTTTGEPQACAFVRVVGLGGDPLNVRSEPHTDGAIVGMLSDGHVVEVLDEVVGDEIVDPALGATDRWYEIEGAGVQGFVTALYTECTEEPTELQWVWPTPETHTIGQDYGNPIEYQSCGFHTGLDLGGALGDPVLAVADGVVVHVGPMWFSGAGQGRGPNAIIVQHGDGPLYSTYGHNDAALVAEGEVVSAGELIAELGTLGYSSGPHLHFEILEGTPFTGDWQVPFNDACAHYRDPKDYVAP